MVNNKKSLQIDYNQFRFPSSLTDIRRSGQWCSGKCL